MPRAFGSLPLSLILLGLASAAGAATAVNDTVSVAPGTTAIVNVTANDTATAPATFVGVTTVTAPTNGSLILTGGRVRYRPTTGFTGTDAFTYSIRDGYRSGAIGRGVLATSGGVSIYNSGWGSAMLPVPGSTTDYYLLTDRGPVLMERLRLRRSSRCPRSIPKSAASPVRATVVSRWCRPSR